jgi:hypothetical protein
MYCACDPTDLCRDSHHMDVINITEEQLRVRVQSHVLRALPRCHVKSSCDLSSGIQYGEAREAVFRFSTEQNREEGG